MHKAISSDRERHKNYRLFKSSFLDNKKKSSFEQAFFII
jgi:hypothetical protein